MKDSISFIIFLIIKISLSFIKIHYTNSFQTIFFEPKNLTIHKKFQFKRQFKPFLKIQNYLFKFHFKNSSHKLTNILRTTIEWFYLKFAQFNKRNFLSTNQSIENSKRSNHFHQKNSDYTRNSLKFHCKNSSHWIPFEQHSLRRCQTFLNTREIIYSSDRSKDRAKIGINRA